MCHMGSIIFSLSEDRETETERGRNRGRERERERGLLPTRCTQKLIKSFEIATEGTCMQSSQGKGLMRLCEGPGLTSKRRQRKGMRESRKRRKTERKKSEVDFLIEAQLEEEHVCLLVLCSRKKVKHAPSRVCLHTQALNGEQVERCRDRGMEGCRRKAPDN